MIYFGQYSEGEQPDSGDRKTPHPNPVNVRQRPTAVRVVKTGRRPEAAA